MRLWDEELMEELLPRDQRDAIKRMELSHYLRCDIRKPCDACLVLEAVRELLSDINTARAALGGAI